MDVSDVCSGQKESTSIEWETGNFFADINSIRPGFLFIVLY
jgi:hypothetical protein